MRELASWLQSTHAASSRTVMTVTPEDILVFLTQHWLLNHAGSETAAGDLIAAPGSLSSTKSHLAQEFELLGRTGDWDAATQKANSMLSVQVTRTLKGYTHHATQLGYHKRGAVPLTEPHMRQLLSSMHSSRNNITEPHQLLLVL